MNIDTIENKKMFFKICNGRLIDIGGAAKRIIQESTLGFVSFIEVDAGKYHLKSDGLFKAGMTQVWITNEADGYLRYDILDESTIELNVLTEQDGDPIKNRLFAIFEITVWISEESKTHYTKVFGVEVGSMGSLY
jgi:hypothetical protein